MSFWKSLPKPFLCLAPMEDVTDTVFRRIIASCARPDVFFTEFISVDGMYSHGRDKILHRLKYTVAERPIVAQIWGLVPTNFYKAAKEIVQMGFDGIDLNFGCPEKNVIKKGACIALINNRSQASEIIQATKEGVKEASRLRSKNKNSSALPVSVKTRIGLTHIQTDDWIPFLLEHNLDALTIHGRTAKELSIAPVHWDEIGKAVRIRDELYKRTLLSESLGFTRDKLSRRPITNVNPSIRLQLPSQSDGGQVSSGNKTLIIGNGDVKGYMDAMKKVEDYKVDGVMIGRGIFQNLWAFQPSQFGEKQERRIQNPIWQTRGKHDFERGQNDIKFMFALMLKHCHLFNETWGNQKSFLILRKFFKIYIQGFAGASQLREKVMRTKSVAEVENILKEFLSTKRE